MQEEKKHLWIDVKEELPEDNIAVLGYCMVPRTGGEHYFAWHGIVQVYFTRCQGWFRCDENSKEFIYVKFWMYIPETIEKPE